MAGDIRRERGRNDRGVMFPALPPREIVQESLAQLTWHDGVVGALHATPLRMGMNHGG
jgi:hypothetical protein